MQTAVFLNAASPDTKTVVSFLSTISLMNDVRIGKKERELYRSCLFVVLMTAAFLTRSHVLARLLLW